LCLMPESIHEQDPGGHYFPDYQYIRFCFCKRDDTLDEAIARLRKLRVIV
jgi:hypothetical protein